MFSHPALVVEPWAVRENRLHLDILAQTESIFALSNGYIGMRGNLDEGEPHAIPGTYLNGCYELRPLPYPEPGYGDPEAEQTLVNVPNGKLIRLLVDDEAFDVRHGQLEHHERVLDLRAGLLTREARWRSPAGSAVRVKSTRMVSLARRAVAAICYEVSPLEEPVQVVLQSKLVANESPPARRPDRYGLTRPPPPLELEHSQDSTAGTVMVYRTADSGLRLAAGMRHELTGPPELRVQPDRGDDFTRVMVAVRLAPGQQLRLVKYLAYGWSSERSRAGVGDHAFAVLAAARMSGWEGLVREQRERLDAFWAGADVEVEPDPSVQQAVRFGLFQVLQASARAGQRPIPAKGLTGPGYDGHTFWDTETFVVPVLTFTQPAAAAGVLRWRRSTLPAATARAQQFGLPGAMFPWRTITGSECSGYWPASTAALHINADIAYAARHHAAVTDDRAFERDTALPLLVATARLWCGAGHRPPGGGFRIDGVTGPDEYSALTDNNTYTNLMARHNLTAAAEATTRYPDRARRLGVTPEETEQWRRAAAEMVVPYDRRLGVHPQSEGFTNHAEWDFRRTGEEQYPLMHHFPYFELYRRRVVKQADLVLAMQLCPDEFTPEQKARNVQYYEPITVRDSSLSAATQAVLSAEVGHLDLAHDYLAEAALIDFDDLNHNTADGMHLASLAGAWIALVAGLGGMRLRGDTLTFTPRLPRRLTRVTFRLRFRKRRLEVTVRPTEATYRLLGGVPLRIRHHGQELTVDRSPVTRSIPTIDAGPRPTQPPGRSPPRYHRDAGAAAGQATDVEAADAAQLHQLDRWPAQE